MNDKNISQAKNADLRGSYEAMHRAAVMARQTAIQTGTGIVIWKEGRVVQITAEELREDSRQNGEVQRP